MTKMSRLIALLKQKNHFLEKFCSLNGKELSLVAAGNYEHLDDFYATRENILRIIQRIDQHLEILFQAEKTDPSLLEEVNGVRDGLVSEIIRQDMDLLSLIEGAKSSIIRELSSVKLTKKGISGYKAPKIRQGLDEEA